MRGNAAHCNKKNMMTDLFYYLLTGAFAGLSAGLLGIGGGLIIVPALYFILPQHLSHIPLMHVALATSLASIIFTSISSTWAHHKHKAIDWHKVMQITPGIIIGSFLAGSLSYFISGSLLKKIFAIFEFLVALQMLRPILPSVHRTLAMPFMLLAGIVIGLVSALVGIGGGTLTVPFLYFTGIKLPNAIATSAACGLPIAVFASFGYLFSGWQQITGDFLGYIYLPALFSIVPCSILFAPAGAWLAHNLPVSLLKKIFAALLILLGLKMW